MTVDTHHAARATELGASTPQGPEQPGGELALADASRERLMQRFQSAEQAQRFLEPFSSVCNHFRPHRHRLTATAYRRLMDEQRQTRRVVTRFQLPAKSATDRPTGTSSVPATLINLTTPDWARKFRLKLVQTRANFSEHCGRLGAPELLKAFSLIIS
jgi:hypothetical protein